MLVKTTLRDHVKLQPHEIGSNYKEALQAKLQRMSEGICTRHGYTVPSSIKVIATSLGRMDGASLNGAVVFEVEYEAMLCNPSIGSKVSARVVNINRFGILAHAKMSESSHTDVHDHHHHHPARDVLEIIVTKQGGATLASDVDLEGIRIGDAVVVEILGKRFELNDTKISIVGRVTRHMPAASSSVAALSENGDMPTRGDDVGGVEEVDAFLDATSSVDGDTASVSGDDASSQLDEEKNEDEGDDEDDDEASDEHTEEEDDEDDDEEDDYISGEEDVPGGSESSGEDSDAS